MRVVFSEQLKYFKKEWETRFGDRVLDNSLKIFALKKNREIMQRVKEYNKSRDLFSFFNFINWECVVVRIIW